MSNPSPDRIACEAAIERALNVLDKLGSPGYADAARAELSALRSASLADKAEIERLGGQLDELADVMGMLKSPTERELEWLTTRAENQRLREALKQIPFAHTKNCSFDPYPNGDACDCGLAERVKMIQTAISDSTPSEQREEKTVPTLSQQGKTHSRDCMCHLCLP